MVENEVQMKIKCLISYNGGEFTSNEFYSYCEENGIRRNISATYTPQQNGVVERKNRTVQEMARTMLNDSKVSDVFWVQAIHTAVYTLNRCLLRSNSDKTPYELWKGRSANVKHFKIFGSKCYIKREDRLGKFESRVDDGIFLGYSSHSKAYNCFNLRLNRMIESINVKVDELPSSRVKKGSEVSEEPFETKYKQESDDDEEAPLEGSN